KNAAPMAGAILPGQSGNLRCAGLRLGPGKARSRASVPPPHRLVLSDPVRLGGAENGDLRGIVQLPALPGGHGLRAGTRNAPGAFPGKTEGAALLDDGGRAGPANLRRPAFLPR